MAPEGVASWGDLGSPGGSWGVRRGPWGPWGPWPQLAARGPAPREGLMEEEEEEEDEAEDEEGVTLI